MINDVLELTDLTGKKFDLVETLSRGMKQRLCLAKTLLHDPAILLLDEPASGLDPRARIEIREIIKELRKMNKTVLISSHILPELSDFCTSIGIIEKGKLIAAGSLTEIEKRLSGSRIYRLTAIEPLEIIQAFLKEEGVESGVDGGGYLEFASNAGIEDVAQLLTKLVSKNFRITSFYPVAANLEDLFMKITKGEVS
jgi:ABC-2 type transport system ATP-binding protein